MNKIFLTGIVAASLTMATSCDSYLDINNNPNSPSVDNMTPSILFPGAEMAFANTYGNFLRITGGYFAQHYAQLNGTSNYVPYSQFEMSATKSGSAYTNLCIRTLQNMETVRQLATASEDNGSYLAATVIRVATFQAMVDCYGEIPYSEGLDISNLSPKYDEGKDIYAGLVKELDDVTAGMIGTEPVCTNNLLPGEKADAWIRTANALKLKLLMRMSGAVDVKSQLDALVAEDNFPAEDIAWAGCWLNETGQANPYFQEEFASYFGSTQKNVCLNAALANTMLDCDDARLGCFFDANSNGEYVGGVSGTNYPVDAASIGAKLCRPAMKFNSPVYLISVAETEFFLAEYYARYGSDSDAKSHYEVAVAASFDTAGASGQEASVLAAYPWNKADYKKIIGIQKWVALSGINNFEAYCEMRRLGYPTFGSVAGEDLYNIVSGAFTPAVLPAGTLYTPIMVYGPVGDNKLIQRWPYPESSSTRNNKTPAFKGYTSPIFWAN